LALAIVQLGMYFRGDKQEEVSEQEEPSARVGDVSASGMASFGWVLAMFAATVVAGFQWGLPLGILLYYKFEGKQRLAVSLVLGAVSWGAIYAWMELLHLPLFKGLLWTYLQI